MTRRTNQTETKLVFAHRYKYRHEKRRKQLKELLKNEKVTLVEQNKDGFLYRVPKELKIK